MAQNAVGVSVCAMAWPLPKRRNAISHDVASLVHQGRKIVADGAADAATVQLLYTSWMGTEHALPAALVARRQSSAFAHFFLSGQLQQLSSGSQGCQLW